MTAYQGHQIFIYRAIQMKVNGHVQHMMDIQRMGKIVLQAHVNVSIGVLDPLVIPVVTPKYRPRKNNLKKINPEHIYRAKTVIQNH